MCTCSLKPRNKESSLVPRDKLEHDIILGHPSWQTYIISARSRPCIVPRLASNSQHAIVVLTSHDAWSQISSCFPVASWNPWTSATVSVITATTPIKTGATRRHQHVAQSRILQVARCANREMLGSRCCPNLPLSGYDWRNHPPKASSLHSQWVTTTGGGLIYTIHHYPQTVVVECCVYGGFTTDFWWWNPNFCIFRIVLTHQS